MREHFKTRVAAWVFLCSSYSHWKAFNGHRLQDTIRLDSRGQSAIHGTMRRRRGTTISHIVSEDDCYTLSTKACTGSLPQGNASLFTRGAAHESGPSS